MYLHDKQDQSHLRACGKKFPNRRISSGTCAFSINAANASGVVL